MSPPRKATPGESGSKSSAKAHTRRRSSVGQSARGDSLTTKLKEARDRWEGMSEVVDVTQVALEEGDGSLIIESVASVLFRFVLEPMRDEIRWLDELIEENPGEAT
jgi:hypothetical protein